MRTVNCIKLKREAEGLEAPPYPGEKGQWIFENVSKEAWDGWVRLQTMLINEYRLSMADAKSRAYIAQEMDNYFSGEGSQAPECAVPLTDE